MKKLIRIIGLILIFGFAIMQSVFANQIVIDDITTYISLLKRPVFWICVAVYVILNIVIEKYDKGKDVVDNEQKVLDAWADTKVELMKETVKKVKNNDLSGADNTLDILGKLNDIIERSDIECQEQE